MLDYLVNQRVATPRGNGSLTRSPHGCYRCKGEDQWCVISVAEDSQWPVFCDVIGNPSLATHPKFDSLLRRLKNREELDNIIQQWTAQLTPKEIMEKLQGVEISAGIVHNAATLSEDSHLRERGFIGAYEHPRQGRLHLPGITAGLSRTPGKIVRHAPLLGQDNNYVFRDLLGLTEKEIEELAAVGAF